MIDVSYSAQSKVRLMPEGDECLSPIGVARSLLSAILKLLMLLSFLGACLVHGAEQSDALQVKVVKARKLLEGAPNRLVVFAGDGNRVLQSSGQDIQVGDLNSGQLLLNTQVPDSYRVDYAALNQDGKVAAVSSRNTRVYGYITSVWNAAGQRIICELEGGGPISLSADGKKLAMVEKDKVAKIFDVESCRKVAERQFQENRWHVPSGSLVFTPNGEQLFIGVDADQLYRLDAETLQSIGAPWPHIQFGPGPNIVFSASGDRFVLFDVRRAAIFETLSGVQLSSPLWGVREYTDSATFSHDGRFLFSVSYDMGYDGLVNVWDSRNGRRLAATTVWPHETVQYTQLLFNHRTKVSSDARLATAIERNANSAGKHALRVAELNTGEIQKFAYGASNPTWQHLEVLRETEIGTDSLAYAAGLHLKSGAVAVGGLGAVWIRRGNDECITKDNFIPGDEGNPELIRVVQFSSGGRLLAVVWDDANGIQIYDTKTCERLSIVKGHSYVVAFSGDDQLISASGKMLRWSDSKTGKTIRKQALTVQGEINSVVVSKDGAIAIGTGKGEVMLLHSQPKPTQRLVARIENTYATALAFTPDGSKLIVATKDGMIRIVDMATATFLSEPKFQVNELAADKVEKVLPIWSLAVNSDQSRLATSYEDGTFRIWDMQTGVPLTPRLFAGAERFIYDIAFDAAKGELLTINDRSRVLRWKQRR